MPRVETILFYIRISERMTPHLASTPSPLLRRRKLRTAIQGKKGVLRPSRGHTEGHVVMDERAMYCTVHPCAVHVYPGIKLSWFLLGLLPKDERKIGRRGRISQAGKPHGKM